MKAAERKTEAPEGNKVGTGGRSCIFIRLFGRGGQRDRESILIWEDSKCKVGKKHI